MFMHLHQAGGQDRLGGGELFQPGIEHAADQSGMGGDTHKNLAAANARHCKAGQ